MKETKSEISKKIKDINTAITMTKDRLNDTPDFEILKSIISQLIYLKELAEDKELDLSKLDKIVIGYYAAHEYEETDPEYSKALKTCQNIALMMKQ
jgi:hypothetical protein